MDKGAQAPSIRELFICPLFTSKSQGEPSTTPHLKQNFIIRSKENVS